MIYVYIIYALSGACEWSTKSQIETPPYPVSGRYGIYLNTNNRYFPWYGCGTACQVGNQGSLWSDCVDMIRDSGVNVYVSDTANVDTLIKYNVTYLARFATTWRLFGLGMGLMIMALGVRLSIQVILRTLHVSQGDEEL